MGNTDGTVGPLKKVSLLISAFNSHEPMDNFDSSATMEFVFGVGIEGLSGFECRLSGKHIGDEIELTVERDKFSETFNHLLRFLPRLPAEGETLSLKIVIQSVSEVPHRDIVKALADATACGDHCGCGCSGH